MVFRYLDGAVELSAYWWGAPNFIDMHMILLGIEFALINSCQCRYWHSTLGSLLRLRVAWLQHRRKCRGLWRAWLEMRITHQNKRWIHLSLRLLHWICSSRVSYEYYLMVKSAVLTASANRLISIWDSMVFLMPLPIQLSTWPWCKSWPPEIVLDP